MTRITRNIVVTAAMIDAARDAIEVFRCRDGRCEPTDEFIRSIYLAMRRVRTGRPSTAAQLRAVAAPGFIR